MPSLTEQLKELGVEVGTGNIRKPDRRQRPNLTETLDGAWEKTRQGDCFVVRKLIPFHQEHGSRRLMPAIDLSALDLLPGLNGLAGLANDKVLFIDTETTGLSGGAGTYVFLIGAAKYEQDHLHFAQFFLQDPASESAQLSALEDFAASTELIVSYNGKSFDLPRIKTRYTFHGWQSPFSGVHHIDLLHIARRLWRRHLPGCSLGDLEAHLLGVSRTALDIPGWQVSEKFFEYLQSGDPESLKPIFYHNEIDVISLVTMLDYISHRLSDPLNQEYRSRLDLVSIADFLSATTEIPLAVEIFQHALSNPDLPLDLRLDGLYSLANLFKRQQDYASALPLWEQSASYRDPRSVIELAKYYEHQARDLQEAMHWTLSAIEVYRSLGLSNTVDADLGAAEYRLERLKRKLSLSE